MSSFLSLVVNKTNLHRLSAPEDHAVMPDVHSALVTGKHWTVLPNFVDCEVFRPAGDEAEKKRLKEALGFKPEALVIICVAALKCGHKRVDYVVREFKSCARSDWGLILAGARTDETPAIEALVDGDTRIRVMPNTPRAEMPGLLRAADVMVMGSLFEMMPIAVLEGLASGLPVLCNNHPVLTWMIGAGQLLSEETSGSSTTLRRTAMPRYAGQATQPCTSSQREATQGKQLNNSTTGCGSRATQQPNNLTTAQPPSGGLAIDMSKDGALSQALAELIPEWIAEHGRQARERALQMFEKEVVISQYVDYYRHVLADGK